MKLCKEFADRIIDLLENTMPGQEHQRLSEHLKDCPSCQKKYDKVKALYGILDGDIVPVPEQEFFDRIKNNIRQREIRLDRFKVPIFIKIIVPAFAFTLLLLFMFRPEKTVDIFVPASVLLEDETIAKISLGGILNDQLIEDLIVIEEDLPIDIDENIAEFSDEERSDFIDILYEELSRLQEDT
ncbi:MAG: zf-HC2 domain-containing protein [bacterium]